MEGFLVDMGTVYAVLAKDAKDAAYLALLSHPAPRSGKIIVQSRDNPDATPEVTEFVMADRACRVCGCTEQRACKSPGGIRNCSWVAWDLCSSCRAQ